MGRKRDRALFSTLLAFTAAAACSPSPRTPQPTPDAPVTSQAPTMPDLVGRRLCTAFPLLGDLGVVVRLKREIVQDGDGHGRVVAQRPRPGTRLSSARGATLVTRHRSSHVRRNARFSMKENEFNVHVLRVRHTPALVSLLGEMGFPEVLVPRSGRISHAQVEDQTDGQSLARTVYELADGTELGVSQLNGGAPLPAGGTPVRVRGKDGLKTGGTVHWAERGYALASYPSGPYQRSLVWRRACARSRAP